MKAIITRENSSGGFDECGMNNRSLVSGLKTEKGILSRARSFARGLRFRVEFFTDTGFYGPAFKTSVFDKEGNYVS